MKVFIDKIEEGVALAVSMKDGVTRWYLPQSYVDEHRLYEGKVASISKAALDAGDRQTLAPVPDRGTRAGRDTSATETRPPAEELPILKRSEPLADSDEALEQMLRTDYSRLLELMSGLRPPDSRRAPTPTAYEWPVKLEDMGDIEAWAGPPATRRAPCGTGRAVSTRRATGPAWGGAGELAVHVLNVAQGDSVVIEFPDGQVYVIDSHSSDRTIRFLRERGITEIDRLIVSHPHLDHIYGITELLTAEDILIKQMWMSKYQHPGAYMLNFTFKWMYHWMYYSPENRLYVPQEGDVMDIGGVKLHVLAPPPGLDNTTEDHVNDASIVLKLVYGSFAMLLTGDAEVPVWGRMLRSRTEEEAHELLRADVLKVSHHASRTGTDVTLLQGIAPQQAIISVGRGNRFDHPHEEVLDLLYSTVGEQNVHRTDEVGTVSVFADGSSYRVLENG